MTTASVLHASSFLFIYHAFPEFEGIFKNVVNHIAIILGTCPITSKFVGQVATWVTQCNLGCAILSVIILVIKQIGLPLRGRPILLNHSYDYRPNWTPLSPVIPLLIGLCLIHLNYTYTWITPQSYSDK